MAQAQTSASGQAGAGIITGSVGIGFAVVFVAPNLIVGFGRILMK